MTDHLGGELIAGGHMKADYGWDNRDNGTNSSGFSGLPGGFRYDSGVFSSVGGGTIWLSSSPFGSEAWYRSLNHTEIVNRGAVGQRYGFSVRCVRDAE